MALLSLAPHGRRRTCPDRFEAQSPVLESSARDVDFTPLGRMTDAFVDGHLFESRELLRACLRTDYLVDVHSADLAHHYLHPLIVGRDMQDMAATEAGAQDTEPVGIDLPLHREPNCLKRYSALSLITDEEELRKIIAGTRPDY